MKNTYLTLVNIFLSWKYFIILVNILILICLVNKFNIFNQADSFEKSFLFTSSDFILKTLSNSNVDHSKTKIGFFLLGTGKYIQLVNELMISLEKHFCVEKKHRDYHVNYFVFTDSPNWKPSANFRNDSFRNYSIVYQKKLGWPYDTLMRFEVILNNSAILDYSSYDYLYWLDADMRLVDNICEDLLGDLVATQHPHYYTSEKPYPYESNTKSKAYLSQSNRYEHPYYVGSLYGGNYIEMMKLLYTCNMNIQNDFRYLNGFIANVHDESHLNYYFSKNHPTIILSRGYCYSEPPDDDKFPWLKKYKAKIYAIRKNKNYIRN